MDRWACSRIQGYRVDRVDQSRHKRGDWSRAENHEG
ncbi:hypothetical protein OESDEN_21697 [Oesophagostomum dentatum]|uniref:Uncharacterized protein n=1 Tax=Oesophagostomum dentatum TaxID=61180 RepID=A0A0B1S671_OESDE|nr:hypothetical protein OESDEN_21697 [Oesophagostomum dentatum]